MKNRFKNLSKAFLVALIAPIFIFTSCTKDDELSSLEDTLIDATSQEVTFKVSQIDATTSNFRDLDTTRIQYEIYEYATEEFVAGETLEPNITDFTITLPEGNYYIAATTWDKADTVHLFDIYPNKGGFYGGIEYFTIDANTNSVEVPLLKKYSSIQFKLRDGVTIDPNERIEVGVDAYFRSIAQPQMIQAFLDWFPNTDNEILYGSLMINQFPVVPYNELAREEVSWEYDGQSKMISSWYTDADYIGSYYTKSSEVFVRVYDKNTDQFLREYILVFPVLDPTRRLIVDFDPNEDADSGSFSKMGWSYDYEMTIN